METVKPASDSHEPYCVAKLFTGSNRIRLAPYMLATLPALAPSRASPSRWRARPNLGLPSCTDKLRIGTASDQAGLCRRAGLGGGMVASQIRCKRLRANAPF